MNHAVKATIVLRCGALDFWEPCGDQKSDAYTGNSNGKEKSAVGCVPEMFFKRFTEKGGSDEKGERDEQTGLIVVAFTGDY